jgi:hypothetical protein
MEKHITSLSKVLNQLAYKQTMNYTTLLLSEDNTDKINEAKELISKAMSILETVK